MTDHDPRCERSAAKRCRCDCGGRLHGAALHAIHLYESTLAAHQRYEQATADIPPIQPVFKPAGELYPGMGDDLKRAGEQMAHWVAERGAPA